MDAISIAALNGLSAVVTDLFDALTPAPDVELYPLKILPTGLGGYIAPHDDPEGDLLGRRIEAQVRLIITGTTPNALATRTAAAQKAVLGLSAAERRQRGLLRVGLDPTVAPVTQANRRAVGFAILYEYIHIPTEAGGIIHEIPITVNVG